MMRLQRSGITGSTNTRAMGLRALGSRTLGVAAFGLSLLVSTSLVHAENKPEQPLTVSNSLAGNYLAARIATTDRDTESAAAFYRRAIGLDPDNNDLMIKGFLTFIANGDFAEGVTLGDIIIKSGKEPEIVSLVMSVEEIRKKSWKSASRHLTKDWRSAVDRLMAGLILGWVQQGSGDGELALKTIDALNGPAWFDLFVQYHGGLVALTNGNTKDAVKRLKTAYDNRAGGQAAGDTYLRVMTALAHAHARNGDFDSAGEIVDQGLRRVPQNPLLERMKSELKADKIPEFSVKTAQRGAAEVFLNLGTAINREGGEQFARIYMQLANTLAHDDDAVRVELAELFDGQGLLARANELFEKIMPESAYYRIARLEYALNLDELDKRVPARKALDELIESGPDDLVAHLSYGAVLARHEDYQGAADVYNKILGRIDTPTRIHWNLYYRLGISYERTKQWPKAEAAFRESLKLSPNQPRVLNYLGYSWIDMDINLQEGLDMIRKAVDLRPNDGYMVDSLGWAYYKLNRIQEAVVELERAVELRPGDPTINDHMGDAYWKANRKLEATFQWQHALALDPMKEDIPRIEEKLKVGLDEVEKKELANKDQPNKG